MKTVAMWSGISAIVFVVMVLQMTSTHRREAAEDATTEEPAAQAEATPGPRFPEDLALAAKAQPIPGAAEYRPSQQPHMLAFVRVNGVLHPWQENVREDWRADTIRETELVVVVGTPVKRFVNRIEYSGGAPPIDRYVFELEISVIEAKTGKILNNRLFRNVPRQIQHREAWETTVIGRAVSLQQVFGYVSRLSKLGFPEGHDPTPIITPAD
jgi:hypothetical protein